MDEIKQEAVFLQIYIIPEKVDSLQKLLNTGANPSTKDSFFDLEKLKSVHFARWIIAPATDKFRASVVYSANIDGSVDNHLKELANELTADIDAILNHCMDYPAESNRTAKSRLEFLRKCSFKTPAFYVGAPNRSVDQIHKEEELHIALRAFVHENKGKWSSEKEAYKAIKGFVANDSKWDWARNNYELPKKKKVKMILFLLLIVALLPFIIIGVIFIFLFHELWAIPFGKSVNDVSIGRMAELKKDEDKIYQNQLSQVFETKWGLRKVMLKFILWATNFAAKNWFVEGQLMGTPTIHFARWVFIDRGRRFVFFSNFDGSFDGYLGDFVDNNGWGLNAIYGAAKGYPRTYFMFLGGSYKISKFLGWGRHTQVLTPIWYSAYPWIGLQQIESKSVLRAELFAKDELNDDEIKDMLRRI